MLYYCNANSIPDNAEEVWFVVRSLQIYKPVKGIVYRHVNVLSPNLELFLWGRKRIQLNNWTKENYNIYAIRYIEQIQNDPAALKLIDYLRKIKEDPSHDIYLVCYCQNFERCHLKILKSIIEYL